MTPLRLLILTHSGTKWTLGFTCPQCQKVNTQPPVPDTSILSCQHCFTLLDGAHVEVQLIDESRRDGPPSSRTTSYNN